ncbi:acetyltransferase (GNAT) domain protein [Leptospira interrogans str. 2003000735]|uniref:Acetyltransferase (GNAT) domain protein n=5 Tax=Leptospira interrogans TaxID=173 RepID=A0A829DF68_LEPIR|nr:GNAT family N-acetyltransferase [Leptospira interrogans]EMF41060.1 acetyltransferase (GNAT) domain protein [Leptospira interrogans serovar Lora str. TE 1992]EMY07116.1 acetyltransferase (GNAT) domain protein [Leptospira interrogans str. 2002000626]EMY26908.1 acetyltransferase (GNAT) domain protein [Leptospira interrogans serovar Australis str. 200703203]KAA1266726.1 N-acetyltransferase [Leptospira interrogans serovar Weerasinghe]AKH79029.1 GNAT family acetyltransferase [Leptospira interroga
MNSESKIFTIYTSRFILRLLTEVDVTEKYLSWFKNLETKKYVVTASEMLGLEKLKDYVRKRTNRNDVLFWGIFEKETNVHIGNVKYEPIDSEKGFAVMGILIGDVSYRGKGVSGEVIKATSSFLKENKNIKQIILGVHRQNHMAIKAYGKLGFRNQDTNFINNSDSNVLTMVLSLND